MTEVLPFLRRNRSILVPGALLGLGAALLWAMKGHRQAEEIARQD
jgi:hypothetical protein